MINTKKNSFSLKEIYLLLRNSLAYHYAGLSTWSIFFAVLILSLLAGINHEQSNSLFMAGETAKSNVYAERTLKIEDPHATQLRRDQTMALQPLIFDLDKRKVQKFRENTLGLLTSISSLGRDIDSLSQIQSAFNKQHGTDFDRSFFSALSFDEIQAYLTEKLLPFAENILLQGIFADKNQLGTQPTAILVRDTETGTESLLVPNNHPLPDLSSFYLSIGQELRNADITQEERRVLLALMESLAVPTLQMNNQVTMQRATNVVSAIPPVYYYIQKGELIAAEGDLVSREQQLKMQALYKFSSRNIDLAKVAGIFIVSLGFVYGLFFSPAGLTGTRLYPRVQVFFSFLLLLFGVSGWLLGWFFQESLTMEQVSTWAFAFPVAGAAGLSALIYSARRFFSIGILLSLFTTLFLDGNIALFIFFFLSAMFNTLLILRSQSRQDVVASTLVLFLGQNIFAVGAALFNAIELQLLPTVMMAASLNSVLSLFIIFALSPIVEMFFNLTTRFRLMELMNLEQPLLQELMMTAPGTYHHSIVVSNLVEAGAKAINANSLLCKVAALYHDIGKIVRPEYFIENQINIPNKHDTLAPAMSALIIISHVKQGVELAEKFNLGKEITDIIRQHHGNRCITYFYSKAVNTHTGESEPPQESDYSYPYERPKSKEAAILILADAIEASSRTLLDPTPARIQSHVNSIVQGIYAEGQLDESELTFRDLSMLSDAFTRNLNGLFHQRIVYPEKKK